LYSGQPPDLSPGVARPGIQEFEKIWIAAFAAMTLKALTFVPNFWDSTLVENRIPVDHV
jgi:hypothetical protein